jgi:hypothetical protein
LFAVNIREKGEKGAAEEKSTHYLIHLQKNMPLVPSRKPTIFLFVAMDTSIF